MKWYYYVMIALIVVCLVGIVFSVITNKKSKKIQNQLKVIEDKKREENKNA